MKTKQKAKMQTVAKADPKECDTPLVSGYDWVAVGKEITRKFKERNNG